MRKSITLVALGVSLLFVASRAYAFSLVDPNSWPFIPIPEVATDPNGGTTGGIIAAFLSYDQQHRIQSIFAPDLNANSTLGYGGTFRYFAYPSADTQWFITAGAQRETARRVEIFYSTGRTRKRWWSLDTRFFWERDPTERFFGIGNTSRRRNETNFTKEQLFLDVKLGINLTENLQVALNERPRFVRIGPGEFDDQPFIGERFPKLKGIDGGSELVNTLIISYDTRDSRDLPHSGGLLLGFAGIADRSLGSSVSYTRFGGEVRRYIALTDGITLAGHAYLQLTPAGEETPFWSMARLGGESSRLVDQQTLRGFGAGRFVDNNIEVFNVEMRTRVFEADLFNTHGILEIAPFLEAGRVSHIMTDNPVNRFHPAGGIGFRVIAEPFVVAYVDVGEASEGASVFSGINYAF